MQGIQFAGNSLRSSYNAAAGASARALPLLCFLFFIASSRLSFAAESGQPKNVLVLYSFSERTLFDPFDHLKSEMRSRLTSQVNFYVDYMEAQAFEDANYEESLSQSLSREYSGVKFDLVIVAAYPALRFALMHREHIFPGVPVLFCYIHDGRLQGQQLWPGVTGVTIPIGVRETLDLSFRLHPRTQNLAVVTGSSEFEQYWLTVIRNEFRAYAGKAKLIEIVGLSNDEILKKVAALPSATVVLIELVPRDSVQLQVGTSETLASITERFPTYCIFANYCVDRGGVGGSFSDYADQTSKTAEIATRLLSGERPENIPIVRGSAVRANVDWRQLRRWNIPDSALPPGTIVLYREPTIWGRYQKYILAALVVIILQTLLIVSLLAQRARKRSVTEALKKLGGRLIHAQEEERARIARELHDDFSQRLAVQHMDLGQLRDKLPDSHVQERAMIQEILRKAREMSADVRSLSHRLYSSKLELVGLVPALRGLCEETAQSSKIDVHFTGYGSPLPLSNDLKLCLFRVCQESLSNIVKHSQAKNAYVQLSGDANVVSLRVSDDGSGFDTDFRNTEEGIGLESMRERLRLVGGKLLVFSELNKGTEVLAEIPVSGSANQAAARAKATGGMAS